MSLIKFSNHEIKEKIAEKCEYAISLVPADTENYVTEPGARLFKEIKKLVEGIISERSVLDNLTSLIKEQEHIRFTFTVPDICDTLDVGEVASLIGRSRQTVYRLYKQGVLDTIPTGNNKAIRITKSSINEYMEKKGLLKEVVNV